MRKRLILLTALLAVGAVAKAEEEPFMALKLRTQTGFQSEAGMRNGFGFGVNYAHKMGPGYLNAELGYQYYSGKQYREPIKSNVFGLVDVDTDPAHETGPNFSSVDSRKNAADGITLRMGWSQPIVEGLSWQAGVVLGKLKNHHESIGTFGMTFDGKGDIASSGDYGSWVISVDKSYFTASPFAGVKWDFNEIGALELNVLFQSLKVTTVEPIYNAGAAGTSRVTPLIGEKSINKPKVEIAYVFKF